MDSKHVLIVEDNANNLQIIAKILKDEGYLVSFSQEGNSALNLIERAMPDLVLLDIMMPGMDGFDVCKRLTRNPKTKNIPVIFITVLTDQEYVAKGFEAGGVDYITKPVNKLELLARVKNHLNLVKTQRELEYLNKKLSDANANLTQKINTLNELYEQVNTQYEDIQSSINSASGVINALLPGEKRMKELLKDCFVFFQPQGTIGGDFYWIKQVKDNLYFSVVDCTGHGVSGALLSLLGTVYLNELLVGVDDIDPAELVEELGKKVKRSFENIATSKKQYDMDLAVCKVSMTEKKLWFSGVKLPVFLCRNGEVEYMKTNKYSLNYNIKNEVPIKTREVQLQTNDLIYLSSDGFIDQIGGEKDKKLMRKGFEELIANNYHKDVEEQKDAFADFFNQWKGNNKQIDDVCVLGMRVPQEYNEVEYFGKNA